MQWRMCVAQAAPISFAAIVLWAHARGTLAYADAFLVIMIVLVIATLLVPFLRNVAPTGTASSQAH